MSNQTGRSIRGAQLMWLSLIIVTVSVALSLAGTLYITSCEGPSGRPEAIICLTPHPFSPRCPS